ITQAQVKSDSGKLPDAIRIGHQALTLTDTIGAAWRQADVRASLAYYYFQATQLERALRLNAEALAIAERARDPAGLACVNNTQGILLDAKGDTEGERREMQAAIGYARQAGAKQLE